MSKTLRICSWRTDILNAEKRLNEMHLHGYALKEANLHSGTFVFEDATPEAASYRIVSESESGAAESYTSDGSYSEVCRSRGYYVLKTADENPPIAPSYDSFFKKNIKQRTFAFFAIIIAGLIIQIPVAFFIVALIDLIRGSVEYGVFVTQAIITLICSVVFAAFIIRFKRLRKIAKSLEAVCQMPFDLDGTIPRGTILPRETIIKLKAENRYLKKTRLLWFYSPDKTEKWLETMEENGYNLIQMSKMGNTFHFVKGSPKKVKYHIDYQGKATLPDYFSMHKDNGWQLFFTSLSRSQSFNVWGQEYTGVIPEFYSDKQDVLRHAKRIALTYSSVSLPFSVMYAALIVWYIQIFFSACQPMWAMLPVLLVFPILVVQFSVIAIKTICYYFRVKKSIKGK